MLPSDYGMMPASIISLHIRNLSFYGRREPDKTIHVFVFIFVGSFISEQAMARKKTDYVGNFEQRCAQLAQSKLMSASKLPLGSERDNLEREARQLLTATHIEAWLMSSGLRSPN